jgi:hypothetical protein
VLLSKANKLVDVEQYKKFASSIKSESSTAGGKENNKHRESLSSLIQSRRGDRYFFLPGTEFMESLVLDFQSNSVVDFEELKSMGRVAKLDSPFAQSMISSFVRYYNRIGFPDIDADFVIDEIKANINRSNPKEIG